MPWVMNRRLSVFSLLLISSQASSTFLRSVRSFLMNVTLPSGWRALSSEMIRLAASSFLENRK